MTTLRDICRDLTEEQQTLDDLVSRLTDEAWDAPTPAPDWRVRDQISHLAFFDEVAAKAVSDPTAFAAQLHEAVSDPGAYIDRALERGRALAPEDVLAWWRAARARSVEVLIDADPTRKVPWFGPPMKPISFVTGRLMETWAHGQDVADALALERAATVRLRHVAHMGVRARAWSFEVNGEVPPREDVCVELIGPDGTTWTWGNSETNVVRGDALDFCLVVTQRRHPADTDLVVQGPTANAWIAIAQAFAGPPGGGRTPGQFPRRGS